MGIGWTHAICCDCWLRRVFKETNRDEEKVTGNIRIPVRVQHPDIFDVTLCCFCSRATCAGIFVRHDPKDEKLICTKENRSEEGKEHYDFFSVPVNAPNGALQSE
jgi:hypothetical protein